MIVAFLTHMTIGLASAFALFVILDRKSVV